MQAAVPRLFFRAVADDIKDIVRDIVSTLPDTMRIFARFAEAFNENLNLAMLSQKDSAQLAMPPAQKPTGAKGAARTLPWEQPMMAAAITPTLVNNESAGAEGAEFIAQDLSQDPPGNDDLLSEAARSWRGKRRGAADLGRAVRVHGLRVYACLAAGAFE